MTPTATTKGTRTYRYYACVAGHKSGAVTCRSRPVPAGPIEGFVVDRVRAAGRDPGLVREVVEQAEAQRLQPVAQLRDWRGQRRAWRQLTARRPPTDRNNAPDGALP